MQKFLKLALVALTLAAGVGTVIASVSPKQAFACDGDHRGS